MTKRSEWIIGALGGIHMLTSQVDQKAAERRTLQTTHS
jgi:hypothetical protein